MDHKQMIAILGVFVADQRVGGLQTGHHRTVEESAERAERELRQAQDVDGMRQEQTLPRGR